MKKKALFGLLFSALFCFTLINCLSPDETQSNVTGKSDSGMTAAKYVQEADLLMEEKGQHDYKDIELQMKTKSYNDRVRAFELYDMSLVAREAFLSEYVDKDSIKWKMNKIFPTIALNVSLESQIAGTVLVKGDDGLRRTYSWAAGDRYYDREQEFTVSKDGRINFYIIVKNEEGDTFQFAVRDSTGAEYLAPGVYTIKGPDLSGTGYDRIHPSAKIYVSDTNIKVNPDDFKIQQLPDNTIRITKYTGSSRFVDIPDTLFGLKVTAIGREAFTGPLSRVSIPNTVTTIEYWAFRENTLVELLIGKNVKTIGENNFRDNPFLTKVVIPDSVTDIGREAFINCGLTSLTLSKNIQTLGDKAFAFNKLTEVTIPPTLKKLNGQFNGNPIKTLIIPNGVTRIERYINTPITTLVIPPSLAGNQAYIASPYQGPDTAFNGSLITRITLPANMDDSNMLCFDSSLQNFYKGQNKRAGTYVKNGPVWSRE